MNRPLFVIEGQKAPLAEQIGSLWEYRELLFFLSWRTIRIRYKQTAIGITWVVLQPLMNMLILTAVFGYVVRVPVKDIPYPAFYFTTLVFWRYFTTAIGQGGSSLVANAQLITKVYFPRLIIPISSVLTPLIDFGLGFLMVLVFLPFFDIWPTWRIMVVPLVIGYALIVALAFTLWLSAVNVRYRDVNYILPFLTQVLTYLTPIIYPIDLVPQRWRVVYSLNPMVAVVEGARWALLGSDNLTVATVIPGVVLVVALLIGGFFFFSRMERNFADVI